jgi:hypothetical protein
MDQDQQDFEKDAAKARIEKIVKLLLMPKGDIAKDCPLREILKKSFIERVLWLGDQTKFSINHIIVQCETCGKCKFEKMPSEA